MLKETWQVKAKRYNELLQIAEAALETSRTLHEHELNGDHSRLKEIKFLEPQCNIITLDYSMSSLEAFINQLGHIFIENWSAGGRKSFASSNFKNQYEKVGEVLNENNVTKFSPEPYDKFKEYRDKRNMLHHVHASEHDTFYEENERSFVPTETILCDIPDIWVSISLEQASDIYNKTKEFIINTCTVIKDNRASIPPIFDEIRNDLLESLIRFPFGPSLSIRGRSLKS